MAEEIRGWIDSEGFNSAIQDGRIHPSQFPDIQDLDDEGKKILHVLRSIDRVSNELEGLRKTLEDLT